GAPDVVSKSRVCPCGVDVDIWKPIANAPKTTALVYWKSGPLAFCEGAEAIARAHGLEPFRVATTHGDHARFTAAEYRRRLGKSAIAIFISSFETQGIALAEAWSMNVPTLAWDPRGQAVWASRSFQSGSSCPYLTATTGRRS